MNKTRITMLEVLDNVVLKMETYTGNYAIDMLENRMKLHYMNYDLYLNLF